MRAGTRLPAVLSPWSFLGIALGIALSVRLAIAMSLPSPVHAQDAAQTPTAGPTDRPPTCVERYPAEGPGGVDLMLGCVVNELVSYVGGLGPSNEPQRLTAYLMPVAAFAAVSVAVVLAMREINRLAARRIAPATLVAWWGCPACRSMNAAARLSCYRCGRSFESGLTELRTDAEAPAPQSFGRRFNGRPRRDGPG